MVRSRQSEALRPRTQHEVLQRQRARQLTPEWQAICRRRAGVEGICGDWTTDPANFKVNPHQLISGSHRSHPDGRN